MCVVVTGDVGVLIVCTCCLFVIGVFSCPIVFAVFDTSVSASEFTGTAASSTYATSLMLCSMPLMTIEEDRLSILIVFLYMNRILEIDTVEIRSAKGVPARLPKLVGIIPEIPS